MSKVSLNVVVVGAGICGLCSAIALKRAGHNVKVLEALSRDESQQGAGIVVMANGSKILERWGIPLESGGMVGGIRSDIVRGRSMEMMFSVDGPEEAEKMGGRFYTGKRSDLLKLLEQSFLQGDGTTTTQVQYQASVVEYDPHKPAVKLSNEEWITADLVVACDGMQMASRSILRVPAQDPEALGIMSVQILHDSEELANDSALAGKGRVLIALDDDEDDRFSWLGWQCDEGQAYASYMRAPEVDGFATVGEEWTSVKDVHPLLKQFKGWDAIFSRLLKTSKDIFVRKIYVREPVDRLYKGRMCVLGDALRPMPPFRAQNIPQAIEDAAVLGVFFTGIASKDDVTTRLQAFSDYRMLHVRTVQTLCGQKLNGPAADAEIERLLKLIRPWYDGRDKSHLESPAVVRLWIGGFDVVPEAQAYFDALAK